MFDQWPEPSTALVAAVERALDDGAFPNREEHVEIDWTAVQSLERVLEERLPADCIYLFRRFANCDFYGRITYGVPDETGVRTVLLGDVRVLRAFGSGLWSDDRGPVTFPLTVQGGVNTLRSWVGPYLGDVWLSKLLPVFVNRGPVAWVCYDFRFDPLDPPLVLVYGEADEKRPILYVAPNLAAFFEARPDADLIASEEYWQETLDESEYELRPRQLQWEASRDAWLEQHRSES